MSYLVIPTDGATVPRYSEIVPLDGIEYLFDFAWSERESCWYFDLSDQDENPIAQLVRVVVSFPLLRRFRDARLPPGFLYAADTSGAGRDVEAQGDLGARVLLCYLTSDDPDLPAAT